MKKILYLECKTGAAGDMLMGALYSLLTEEQKVLFLEKLNAISEEVCVIPQEICKQGNRWDSYEGGDQWYRRRNRSTSPP